MKISDLLRPEVVILDMASPTGEAAVAQLVSALAKTRGVDAEVALKDVATRERTGSTLFPLGPYNVGMRTVTVRPLAREAILGWVKSAVSGGTRPPSQG